MHIQFDIIRIMVVSCIIMHFLLFMWFPVPRSLMLRDPVLSHSPGFEDYANEVRRAFSQLQALQEEFSQNADNVDTLCPGVRDQLTAFTEMAQKHAKSVLEGKPEEARVLND